MRHTIPVVAANIVCILLAIYLIFFSKNIFWGGLIVAMLICELALHWVQKKKDARRQSAPAQVD